jgi:hypothetical protein
MRKRERIWLPLNHVDGHTIQASALTQCMESGNWTQPENRILARTPETGTLPSELASPDLPGTSWSGSYAFAAAAAPSRQVVEQSLFLGKPDCHFVR